MMQQQIAEQNQTGCQQPGQQQMVLCPVRVVYETQMLMQPGEQIQPNQTIYINPQNPPPWAQNRQPQNQVIYVQHMPNNYMPSVQAHMDPNQMYYQQAYQQIVQQPMIPQGHDMRMYQINMVPANMVPSSQNIGPNIPNQVVQQNEMINEPNYIQMSPNAGPNAPIPNVNSPHVVKQQNINVQAMQNQQMINQRQVYLNPPQQSNQQVNMTRPQLITVHPMQQPNVQTVDKTQASNVAVNQHMHPMFANTMASKQVVNTMAQTEPRIRKITPQMNQIPNVRNAASNYLYRPIQPRPPYRPNIPNVNIQSTISQIPNPINLQPPPYINQDIRKVYDESRTLKRKSESPDELNRKLTIVNINTTSSSNPIRMPQAPVNAVKSVEIGVNTSPIHRPKSIYTTNYPKLDMNKNVNVDMNKNVNVRPNEEAVAPNSIITSEKDKEIKANLDTIVPDKIRYTVFPQARARPPKDEFNKVNVNILKDTKNILYSDEKNEFKIESRSLLKEKILNRAEVKKEIEEKDEVNKKIEEATDTKTESVKGTKDFVLTHVLDGIVIQESNTAFPIRAPSNVSNTIVDKKREAVKVDDKLKGSCLELPIPDTKLMEDRTQGDQDNPFIDLKTATVKSWTVDDLCSHLAKYNWEETVSLLLEHEIDGESLFLVSKPQLLHIGVKEKYADIICDFVKS